jgi:hypothetical protein
MADGSQQLMRIMETQTRFNLAAAVENWRRELAAQPGIMPDDCRELEVHLLDSIAQLRKVGLGEEEAFWLARRRIGLPKEICEEFGKENPAKVWRDRLLWIAVALLGLQLWESACFSLTSPLVIIAATMKSVPTWLDAVREARNLIGNELIYVVTAIWFAIQVHRGRMGRLLSVWEFLSQSRLRFLSVSVPLVLTLFALENLSLLPFGEFAVSRNDELLLLHTFRDFGYQFLLSAISPLAMVGFIAWLIPGRQKEEAQLAAAS